jgi:predicted TIM-barrel fold metal-dependent hydrolase
MDFAQFQNIPIIDGHVHFVHPGRMDEILALMDEAGHGRANLVCIPNLDASTHNPAALYFKERCPERVFLSGALEYAPVLADRSLASETLAGQVRALKAQGFDGLKLIEGKPQVRKLLPIPLDAPEYAGMWQALEEEQFPVVFHVADPDEFWDPERCPDWAKASGWDYTDGSYPSKEDCYDEVDHILERHQDLKITFAHFYFLSAELERAARFMEAHPGVCFDLAPNVGMYYDFSREPARARDFFLRYSERIVYGTDMDTRVLERGPEGYAFMRSIPWLVRAMLEMPGEFRLDSETFHGLDLPRQVLEQVYHGNFERIYQLGRG